MNPAPAPHAPAAPAARFDAVLWDLDGTLVDSEPLHERALAASLAVEGLQPPADMHARVLGLSSTGIHAMFQRDHGLRADLDTWLAHRWSAYLAGVKGLQPRPGVREIVEALHAAGCPQVVVSNGDRRIIEANLAAAGLTHRMAFWIGREDVRRAKPDPEPYLQALDRLGLRAGRVAVVEDSRPGAEAGVAAGCVVFHWPEPGSQAQTPAGAQPLQAPAALRDALLQRPPVA